MGLFGGGGGFLGTGKNSIFSKPLGTGKGSVNKVVEDAIGPTGKRIADWSVGAYLGGPLGAISSQGGIKGTMDTVKGIFGGGGKQSVDQLSKQDVMAAMQEGERKGEIVAGTSAEEAGKGRAKVRKRLEDILAGDSVGANRLRESQAAQQKQLKAQQAYAGGQGGQMAAGQQQQQQAQQDRALADYLFTEQRQTLSDLSKEYRGAGSDIMKMSGQYGSILVGSRPPAQPNYGGGGILSNIFGGIF